MFGIGLFIGVFIGLMVAWGICVANDFSNDAAERTVYIVVCLCCTFIGLVVATIGHYEGWFEVAEKVIEVVQ